MRNINIRPISSWWKIAKENKLELSRNNIAICRIITTWCLEACLLTLLSSRWPYDRKDWRRMWADQSRHRMLARCPCRASPPVQLQGTLGIVVHPNSSPGPSHGVLDGCEFGWNSRENEKKLIIWYAVKSSRLQITAGRVRGSTNYERYENAWSPKKKNLGAKMNKTYLVRDHN